MQVSTARGARVSFHSTSTWLPLGLGEQRQLGDARTPASPPRPPAARAGARAMRAMVAASNRSVLYSKPPRRPVRRLAEGQLQLELGDAALHARSGRSDSSGVPSSAAGAFWNANSTWKRGARLRSRSGWSSSTSFSKGRSWWAKAPSVRLAARAAAARGRWGCPSSRVRSASVLTKKPMSPSSSAWSRPAMGVPTQTSSWPE